MPLFPDDTAVCVDRNFTNIHRLIGHSIILVFIDTNKKKWWQKEYYHWKISKPTKTETIQTELQRNLKTQIEIKVYQESWVHVANDSYTHILFLLLSLFYLYRDNKMFSLTFHFCLPWLFAQLDGCNALLCLALWSWLPENKHSCKSKVHKKK